MSIYSNIDHIQINIYNLKIFFHINILSNIEIKNKFIDFIEKDNKVKIEQIDDYKCLIFNYIGDNISSMDSDTYISSNIYRFLEENKSDLNIPNDIDISLCDNIFNIIELQNETGFFVLF